MENGTSYADAWDGFNHIVWGASGVQAGDTLYVCGTHELVANTPLTVGASGSAGSPITLRGDYAGDPGVIDGSADIKGKTWTNVSGNIWTYANGYSNYVLINDKFARQVFGLDNLTQEGQWAFDYGTSTYIYLYCPQNPSTYAAFQTIRVGHYSKEVGIKVVGKSYVNIDNITLRRIETRKTIYAETDGAILIDNSTHCKVVNSLITQCGRGIMVAGTSDNCTVKDNFVEQGFLYASGVYWYAVPIYSVANYPTICGNRVDGMITFYDNTTLCAGQGIALELQDYPDFYCLEAQIYGNEVCHVSWWGIRCQQFITNTGIHPVNINVYENYIHDSIPPGLGGSGEEDGIGFGSNAGDANNYFTGVRIYRNIIRNFINSGVIVCNYWDNVSMYANLITGCGYDGAGGIYLAPWMPLHADVYNNTIYDCRHDGIVSYSPVGSSVVIRSNIIDNISFTVAGHGKAVYSTSGATGGYNCFYNIAGSPATYNFANLNGIVQDPLFLSAAGSDFHLADTSPCIDAGTNVGLDYDLDGNAVTGTPDIGCYTAQKGIQGTVDIQDYVGTVPGMPVTMFVRNSSGLTLETHTVVLNSNGSYAFTSPLRGTYAVVAKAEHWLAQAKSVIITGYVDRVNFSLINGDVNGNNTVNAEDLSILLVAIDGSSGGSTDLDGDGTVTSTDLSIILSNMDLAGDIYGNKRLF